MNIKIMIFLCLLPATALAEILILFNDEQITKTKDFINKNPKLIEAGKIAAGISAVTGLACAAFYIGKRRALNLSACLQKELVQKQAEEQEYTKELQKSRAEELQKSRAKLKGKQPERSEQAPNICIQPITSSWTIKEFELLLNKDNEALKKHINSLQHDNTTKAKHYEQSMQTELQLYCKFIENPDDETKLAMHRLQIQGGTLIEKTSD
jgi:hypothetical protein